MQAIKKEASNQTARIIELEYELINARDVLSVVAHALRGFAEGEAVRDMVEADRSLLFGSAAILEGVSANCSRVLNG